MAIDTLVPERSSELELTIAEDPDNLSAYGVYADWLLERSDRRGELIAADLVLSAAPDDVACQQRVQSGRRELENEFHHRIGRDFTRSKHRSA